MIKIKDLVELFGGNAEDLKLFDNISTNARSSTNQFTNNTMAM